MLKGGTRISGKKKSGTASEPLVSVITVVLNGEKYLEQTVASVLGQSYTNVEYIVIDGGSTDSTVEILKKYDDRIDHWQSAPDKGIYFAMNTGIALAKGDIIGILNADDFYLPDALKKVVDANVTGGADIYYGDILLLTSENSKGTSMQPDISKMDEKPSIFHPACFVKKKVYESAGVFDMRFKISSDYEFLLRCLRKNFKFQYLAETLTAFRAGGMSASCASNVEGYKIMKMHGTGYHRQVIWRALKCYVKTFLKKIVFLNKKRS